MHFTLKREATIYFIDITKFDNKCDSGWTKFDGMVHLIIYFTEVQKGPTCFLNSLSEKDLHAARSTANPRLGQWFMSKGYIYMPKQSSISLSRTSKFSRLLITYWESVRVMKNSQPWEVTLKGNPTQGEILACRTAQGPPIYKVRWLTYSNICIPARHLGHSSRQPLATMLPFVPQRPE